MNWFKRTYYKLRFSAYLAYLKVMQMYHRFFCFLIGHFYTVDSSENYYRDENGFVRVTYRFCELCGKEDVLDQELIEDDN
jgi:hypothetical protein